MEDFARARFGDGRGPSRVLEIGCGPGFAIKQMAASNPECLIVGCDIDSALLAHAAAEIPAGGASFLVRNESVSLPFADGAFDYIFSEGSFHHFDDPGKMVSEMKRVLKPGGGIFIADLDPGSAPARFIIFVLRLASALGVAGSGHQALLHSIRSAVPVKRIMEMYMEEGMLPRVRKMRASMILETEKPF